MRLSVIVPTLNEGAVIEGLLRELQPLRRLGHEVIVSDGGSDDDTCARAQPLVDRLLQGRAGRAAQMNRGAAVARGDILWFLHADTRFPVSAETCLAAFSPAPEAWGFCMVRLDAPQRGFRIIEWFMNRRSRLTRVATGDQGMFVARDLFQQLGGFAEIPLMEDVELSKRLRQQAAPQVLAGPLLASARRWQRGGILRTVLLMWRLRLAYFLGAPPQRLAEKYRLCRSPTRES